ncbi:MAG: glycerol-3-phosphate cytidylyltransferase [Pedobacter sp.]|jgi:glycerol-3-phosphate cytidylyltransferase|nr:glycerol-3-phosphate cytidylyltransferase [Pedobacter sp.]
MGKTIGYTTGVFDLFHIGHLNILKNARKQCDELIVGITTDELCYELKNKMPIIPFSERVAILEALRIVDRVVPQITIDEIHDCERFHFHKIFKGSDWKGSPKWDNLEVQFAQFGVEVVYFDYTETTSSSLIRSILNKMHAEELQK